MQRMVNHTKSCLNTLHNKSSTESHISPPSDRQLIYRFVFLSLMAVEADPKLILNRLFLSYTKEHEIPHFHGVKKPSCSRLEAELLSRRFPSQQVLRQQQHRGFRRSHSSCSATPGLHSQHHLFLLTSSPVQSRRGSSDLLLQQQKHQPQQGTTLLPLGALDGLMASLTPY